MTDLRTHWSRTSHEALCGLTAKRLLLGERIISGEYSHDDVTCPGCRAVLRTAWQPIETAPRADDDAPPWVLGLYVGGHVYAVMPLRSGGWMDMDGNRRHAPIAWAPLPAAPEAP